MGRTELRAQAAVYHDESVLASFVSPFFFLVLSSSYKPLFLPLLVYLRVCTNRLKEQFLAGCHQFLELVCVGSV